MGNGLINYMRNSVKVVVDAYDGTTTFYVFDTDDPIIAAYRGIFPSLFKNAYVQHGAPEFRWGPVLRIVKVDLTRFLDGL